MNINPLKVEQYKRIVVLTGAGISVSAGLRPYRGPGGLWEEEGTQKYSTSDSIKDDPAGVWKFWGTCRTLAGTAQPTAAHIALADVEKRLPSGSSLTLITQNVDGLHQRAGSSNVVELHGSLFRSKCSQQNCKTETFKDMETYNDGLPLCKNCNSPLRPDIVFFNEALPVDAEWHTKRALRDCDLFVAIGTSGSVSPASRFVEWAKYAGAKTALVNLEPMAVPSPSFDREVLGRADDVVPALF